MRRSRRRAGLGLVGVFIACLVVSACSPLYVLRSGYEEARILLRRQPIEDVLQRPDLDAEARRKLGLVLAVRTFARDVLKLRVGGSFASLARVDDEQVVHVVLAAYRDRLQLRTWWFPIVGAVPYRGYFDEADARAEAAALEADGYDTVVQPSVAFSTLGWFDDPLLSNLLRYDEVSLAGVIIHELTHNTRYLAGHSGFNESFANFVGYCGAVAFFEARDNEVDLMRARQLWQDSLTFSAFLDDWFPRLEAAYLAGIPAADRAGFFDSMQAAFMQLPLATNLYARFSRGPMNNARLLHHRLYDDRLALFESVRLRYGGDLAASVAAILAVADGAAEPYAAVAAWLSSPARSPTSGTFITDPS